MESHVVTGIVKDEAQISVRARSRTGWRRRGDLSPGDANINVDMIVQNVSEDADH